MNRGVFFLFGMIMLCGAPAALAQSGPALPMRPGYYAQAPETCAVAIRDSSGLLVRARSIAGMDGINTVTRVSRTPTGEYALTEQFEYGEEGKVDTFTSKIRVINPTSFVRTVPNDNPKGPPVSSTYRFCSTKPPPDWNF